MEIVPSVSGASNMWPPILVQNLISDFATTAHCTEVRLGSNRLQSSHSSTSFQALKSVLWPLRHAFPLCRSLQKVPPCFCLRIATRHPVCPITEYTLQRSQIGLGLHVFLARPDSQRSPRARQIDGRLDPRLQPETCRLDRRIAGGMLQSSPIDMSH